MTGPHVLALDLSLTSTGYAYIGRPFGGGGANQPYAHTINPKTMGVDDLLVTVGSANFDNRSFRINDEVILNALDRGVAAEHKRIFENDLKRSKQVTLEEHLNRPFYIKAVDGVAGLFRSQF